MLIDNKNVTKDQLQSLWEFIEKYTKNGDIDLVSGYFSIPALACLIILKNVIGKKTHINIF